MIPNKVTIPQLFNVHGRHLVPIFQRPYVWTKQNQWEPLWEDISRKAHEVINGTGGAFGQNRRHFLGAVVVKGLPAIGLQYPSTEIIDGQQRMTTLQVLLIALRDYTRHVKYTRVEQMLVALTENPTLSGDPYERYKVLPTTTDRAFFESVWKAGSPEELLKRHPLVKRLYHKYPDPPPLLIGAYLHFYNAIKVFSEETGEGDGMMPPADEMAIHKRLEALVVALTQHIELVRIDLEQDDDPQIIFETLNARGERLLPTDLMRNFIFLEAARQVGNQDQVAKLYNTYWLPYDNPDGAAFWKAKVTQGRLSHPRIDLFLFHFLTSFIEDPKDDIQLGHLFRTFQNWWRSPQLATQPRKVEPELQRIQRYAEKFRRLFTDQEGDRLDLFARRVRVMDTSTVYPLLLFLLVERAEETAAERDGILLDIESYLVRRMICGLPQKAYNRIFVRLLTELRKGGQVTRAGIQSWLLTLSGATQEWPTDEQFRTAWLERPVYELLRQQRTVMVLEALERKLYGPLQEYQRPPSGALTVEHLLPQTPVAEEWPLPVLEDIGEQARQAAITQRSVLRHTFGNLTLVTGPLNSTLSNGPWSDKLPELRNSVLRLNRYWDAHQIRDWGEARIRERGERLFDHACQIWPRP